MPRRYGMWLESNGSTCRTLLKYSYAVAIPATTSVPDATPNFCRNRSTSTELTTVTSKRGYLFVQQPDSLVLTRGGRHHAPASPRPVVSDVRSRVIRRRPSIPLSAGPLHPFEADSLGADPVQRESRDRPARVAHKPDGAHIVTDKRVPEDRMQRRGLNDEAGITHRNGVGHVQFIASVFTGKRGKSRLRNIKLDLRKLQQPLSFAVDHVPRSRPSGFGRRELDRGTGNEESVRADRRHHDVVVVAVEIPHRELAIANRHQHDVVLVRSKAVEAGPGCQFIRRQAHRSWWRRAGAWRGAWFEMVLEEDIGHSSCQILRVDRGQPAHHHRIHVA